jgi:hypothetical protein
MVLIAWEAGIQAILIVQRPTVGQAQDAERGDELGNRCHLEEAVGRLWLAISVAADDKMLSPCSRCRSLGRHQ